MGMKEVLYNTCTKAGLLCFHRPIELGFLCVLLVCSSSSAAAAAQCWKSRVLGFLDHFPFLATYNLLVLLFLIFLWRKLARHCQELDRRLSWSCPSRVARGGGNANGIGANGLSGVLDEEEEEEFDVEEEEDVARLREEVRRQRRLRAAAESELEKERGATLSAADEAMAKILVLQNEKGMVEREARQYREVAEQKQVYDSEVIDNLKWIVSRLGGGDVQ